MLSGLLFCAECGGPIYIYRRKSKGHLYYSYYCENSCFSGIKQDRLESLIMEACGDIMSPENIRMWIDMMTKAEMENSAKEILESTESDLKSVTKKINSVMDLLLSHPSEALAQKIQELEAERKQLQERLDSLSQPSGTGLDTDILYDITLEACNRILSVLRPPDAIPEVKKTALTNIVRSIVVDRKGNVAINYLPPCFRQSCRWNEQPPIKNPADRGSVVSQNRLNSKAPPEGVEPPTS